nr:hypothetical protein BHI3_18470 [Bacteriovorax sp. HI3]
MRTLLFSLLFTLKALASDCTDVTVETKYMPKNNNQGNLNWCFAWTAADLLSTFEETPLSAYDVALQYHNHPAIRDEEIKKYTDVGGNDGAALIVSLQGKGLCLESQTNYTGGDWEKLSAMVEELSDPDKTLVQTICEHGLRDQQPFKDLSNKVIKILNKLSGDKKMAALLDVTCGERHQFKNKYGVGTRAIENFSQTQMMDKLDQLLTQKSPAAVAYDVDLIMSPADYQGTEANHSSTIIGRRKNPNNGQCEYLIKNSWGDRCPRRATVECTSGNYWVPRDTLKNNMYEINWLQKR